MRLNVENDVRSTNGKDDNNMILRYKHILTNLLIGASSDVLDIKFQRAEDNKHDLFVVFCLDMKFQRGDDKADLFAVLFLCLLFLLLF